MCCNLAVTANFVQIDEPPAQPSNLWPANGARDINLTPTLQSSAFSDPDAGDTHAASQWQVTITSGDYSSPVFDSGTSTTNLISITVPSGMLSYSTIYYWHVRHQDNHDVWSSYSNETSFTTLNNPPNPPTNISPANGARDINLTPTLQSSAFSDPDAGDTHAASQWQVTTTSGDYSSPVFDSGTSTTNLISIIVPSGTLNYSTIYYWHVRYQDNHGAWSNYSPETSFTTTIDLSPNQAPNKPSNVSPPNGANGVSLTPVLTSSAFSDPDAGDSHVASQWQIRTSSGSYSSPLFDSGTSTTNLTSITVPSGTLNYSTIYYWHVRYQDNHGAWSSWSAETSFTTAALPNQAPNQPSNVSPLNGANGVSLTPVLTSSAFSDPDAGDAHVASQWQIRTSSGSYSSPLFNSGTSTTNLTSITVPSGILSYSTTYYWHVRHQDSHSAWSSWSAETSFTTAAPPFYTAIFDISPQITSLTVDGTVYSAAELPKSFTWATGSVHSCEVPSLVPDGEGTRYVFQSWSDGSTSLEREISQGGKYTANYTTQYYLTVVSDYGDPVGEGWYDAGSIATISVTSPITETLISHLFTAWSGDSTATTETASLTMDGPKTVTANWQTKYYLTVVSDYGDPVGEGWYDAGATALFSVSSLVDHGDGTGHAFTYWSGDSTETTPSSSIVMDSPKSVVAHWKLQYYLTIGIAQSDIVAISDEGWYDEGATALTETADAIISAGTDTRYVFLTWSVDGTPVAGNPVSVDINAPHTVVANYKIQYYLTVESNYGCPEGAGWYDSGSTAAISVTSPVGAIIRQVFLNWSGDSTETTPTATVIMDGPKSVAATWGTNYTQLYILIGGVVALAGATSATIVLVRRKRRAY
jgi:hypothetical protein